MRNNQTETFLKTNKISDFMLKTHTQTRLEPISHTQTHLQLNFYPPKACWKSPDILEFCVYHYVMCKKCYPTRAVIQSWNLVHKSIILDRGSRSPIGWTTLWRLRLSLIHWSTLYYKKEKLLQPVPHHLDLFWCFDAAVIRKKYDRTI